MTREHTGWDGSGSDLAAELQAVLTDVVETRRTLLAPLGPDADRLLDAAQQAVTGGKRLRASFCWWGYAALAPVDDPAALLRACASLELLHASALAHDDLMDASDTRRGQPSAHRAFAAQHRELGWGGGAEEYGAAGAILLGDLLLSWSDEVLRTCGLPAERVLAGLRMLDLTRTEVVAGQFLDVSVQARGAADVDAAMTVLRYKSAKYSVERPLHVGAALAGADGAALAALSRFGLPLGEAFQLRDDVLGVFGDPALTGKPAGDDLVEGKRTVLVALALDALPASDAARLDAALGTALAEPEVDELRELIRASGALAQLEAVIEQLSDTALEALATAPVREPARAALGDLAARAVRRTV
ncbi:polyprenyl synthetase family protein [Nocardioides aequoreus]|uniref:polyprenyl synthetase family protein n=1 Tax=Nocardioides aequoreus TaxID=397278 RepID=UPI000AAF50F1|nr:polyprenyl synthetase family protein [Nocardioides aequoreus]